MNITKLIKYFNFRRRFLSGRSIARPKVLFPRITRSDADKDITHLIKYLLNFAFYKFGVEVTLLMLAILIIARVDVVAVLYAIWLCFLFGVSRETKHRVWPIFQSFIVILIVIQYVVAVNLPPFLCFGMSLWFYFHSFLFSTYFFLTFLYSRLSLENRCTATCPRVDVVAWSNAA